jgi:hypothetical protein
VRSAVRRDGPGDLSEIQVIVRLGRLGFSSLLSSSPDEPPSCLAALVATGGRCSSADFLVRRSSLALCIPSVLLYWFSFRFGGSLLAGRR